MKKIFIVLSLLTLVFFVTPAWADTLGQGLLNESVGDLGLESNLENSLGNIISTALATVGTVFLVLTVVAGIMWMTAAGNEDKISKAKKIIIGATIGLIISMTAYTITYFVTRTASGSGSSGEVTTPEST